MMRSFVDLSSLADQILSQLANTGSGAGEGSPTIEIHGTRFRWSGLECSASGIRAVYLVEESEPVRAYRLGLSSTTQDLRTGLIEALEHMERLMAPVLDPQPLPPPPPRGALRSLMQQFLSEHGFLGEQRPGEAG